MFRSSVAVGVAIAALAVGASSAFAGSGWAPTGAMSAARGAHEATLLDDGRVLVVSGFDGVSDVPGAELFDPRTESWSLAAPPLTPRHYATATKLEDGRVLVAGGFTPFGITRRAELYDPAANSWTATGLMVNERQGHRAVRLDDGRVLVTGGGDASAGAVASAEIYDPATGTWTPAASMAVERENHQVTLLPDGRVLVVGGFDQRPTLTFHATSEIFDPSTGAWTAAASMGIARGQFAGALLRDGTVLVANGVNSPGFVTAAERFDPVAGTWSAAGDSGVQGNVAYGVALRDGRFLMTLDGSPTTPLYDPTAPSSVAWSRSYASGERRSMPSITPLNDGRVLLAGGAGTGGVRRRSAEIFTAPTERGATGGDFGTVDRGAAIERDVTLSNEGGNPLWIDAVAVAGPHADEFAVVADGCSGRTLAPTGTCVVRVRFAPTAVGTRNAELTVDDNAEASPAVRLAGVVDVPSGRPLDPTGGTTNPSLSVPPAATPAAQCLRRFVTLAGIAPTSSSGTRLRLTGVAAASLAGRTARIERNGRVIGTTRVAPDGRIDATVTASRSDRARRTDRYRLVVPDGARSRALKAQRRVSAERTTRQASGTVVVTGRVRDVRRAIPLTLRSDAVCGPKTRRVIARTDRRGRFRVTLPAPPAGSPATIHRLWWGNRSVSLPVVATPR